MIPLSSEWGCENYGLNKHLIAKIYPVNDDGLVENADSQTVVAAPLTDGNIDISLNWQSAFENSGTDSKLPAISQLLQSGQASTMLNLMAGLFGGINANVKNALETTAKQASDLKGRTGITKLNSRQVFSGMPPIKIPITMYFRAWKDPMKEVELPINELISWALPQKLANGSILAGALEQIIEGKVPDIDKLFPSFIPKFVALEYGGRTYTPLVIESVGHPLVLPRSKDGEILSVLVQVTLATLTAWDKNDFLNSRIKSAKPIVYDGDFQNFV